MMRLPRDILLISLAIILTAFGTIVPTVTDLTLITAIPYFVTIAALVFALWSVVRGIQVIDKKEAARQKDEARQLMEETVKKTVKETLEDLGLIEKKEGKGNEHSKGRHSKRI